MNFTIQKDFGRGWVAQAGYVGTLSIHQHTRYNINYATTLNGGAASQVFAQQRDLALRDRSDHQLVLVDEALARLDDGTFGMCVRCGQPIAPGRLEALPWAARCIDCQRLSARER
jgi:DnaK suppressor protein